MNASPISSRNLDQRFRGWKMILKDLGMNHPNGLIPRNQEDKALTPKPRVPKIMSLPTDLEGFILNPVSHDIIHPKGLVYIEPKNDSKSR